MIARVLVHELVLAKHPVLRQPVKFVLPVIPDGAPADVSEGLARHRIAATSGTCPCGAVTDYGDAEPGSAGVGEIWHNRECPGDPDRLAEALARWSV